MNYYNLLYGAAISTFFGFFSLCAMDVSRTESPFSQFRGSINRWIPVHKSWQAGTRSVDIDAIKKNYVLPTAQSLKDLMGNLTNNSPLASNSSIWALINGSSALYPMQDPENVKGIIFTTYFTQHPDKLCPELQLIAQTIDQNTQDKQDLLALLTIKEKEADALTKNLIAQISPLVTAEKIDFMNMRTIDRTISQICSQQAPEPDLFSSLPQEVPAAREKSISEQVNEIVDQNNLSNREKAAQLNDLYKDLLETKPNERKELAVWLKKEDLIKSAYKKLKQKAKTPVTSAEDFNNQFNDLNRSTLFYSGSSDTPEPSPTEVFKSSYDYIINNIDSLKNNDLFLENTKYNLIDNLEKMMIFIHDYDLNPKEKSAPYESYRCWLLSLIKDTILSLDTFTQEQVENWKQQIRAIDKTTRESLDAKSKGNALYSSELGVNTYLVEENQPTEEISPTTNVSQKQDITKLKEILKQQEEDLKINIYNLQLLRKHVKTLTNYRNMVTSPSQKKEISELIKIAHKKIRQINIIAPKKQKQTAQKAAAIYAVKSQSQQDQINDIENNYSQMDEKELTSAISFLEDILNKQINMNPDESRKISALIGELYAEKGAIQLIAQISSEESASPVAPQTLTAVPKSSIKGQPFVIDHPTHTTEKLIPSITTTPNQAIEAEPTATITPTTLTMPSQRQQLPVQKKPSLQLTKPMPTMEQTPTEVDKPAPQQVAHIDDNMFNTLINPLLYINFPDDQSIVYLENLIKGLDQRGYKSFVETLENIYVATKVKGNLTDPEKSRMRETIIDLCNKLKPQPAPTWRWWNPISWITAATSWVVNSINNLSSWLSWLMGE